MSDDQIRELLALAAGDPGEPPTHHLLARMRQRQRRRRYAGRGLTLTAVIAAGAVIVTATGGATHPGAPGTTTGGISLAADLTPYSSCDALLADLISRATPLVTAYGIGGGQQVYAATGAGAATSATAGTATAGTAAAGTAAAAPAPGPQAFRDAAPQPLAHSSTTDRTRGVDEPDITKTDGRLFLSLRGGKLRVYDAVHPALLGTLTVGDGGYAYGDGNSTGPGLLLTGHTAVITGLQPPVQQQGDTRGASTVAVVDLTDPKAPKLTRTLSVDGDVVDARLVDGLPRLILHAAPPSLRWFTPTDGSSAAQAEARDRNLAILKASTIEDWLPTYSLADAAQHDLAHGRIFDCDAVLRDTAPTDGADLVGTTAFEPSSSHALEGGLAVVGAGDTAYVAGAHLWIATGSHGGGFGGCGGGFACPAVAYAGPSRPQGGSTAVTQVHGFDITDPAHTTSLASATLHGSLRSDYALNDAGGTLSVLLSQGGPEPGQGTQDTTLVDLRLVAGKLTQVGGIDSLSPGESFQSARWIGSLAFVVTFRQIDPLVVIDLSDPAKPVVRASLPSADTSTLLLQTDTGRLLGLGTGTKNYSSVVAKLYDVSDSDHPKLLHAQTLPGGGSNAVNDPHELLYWRAGRLLFVPTYDGKVQVTTVGRDSLSHRLTLSQETQPGRGSTMIDRAVLIGADAWTVSDRGVLVSNLAGGATVAWLPN